MQAMHQIVHIKKVLLAYLMLLACSTVHSAGLNEHQHYSNSVDEVTPRKLLTGIRAGDQLDLTHMHLEGEPGEQTLQLERFDVFANKAEIIIHHDGRIRRQTPRKGAYYHGHISGFVDSLAVLSVDNIGRSQGIIQLGDRIWVLQDEHGTLNGRLHLINRQLPQENKSAPAKTMTCGLDTNQLQSRASSAFNKQALPLEGLVAELPTGQLYQATIAIESDGEFYALFGNPTTATQYIANLFAYASTIYERETQTRLTIGEINLWTSSNNDPWNFITTNQGLTSFGNYWRTNKQLVTRTAAHFLSGKDLGGGIAYINGLCNNDYGYGLSASLQGTFSINNPQPLWDIYVVTHEIGHNFNSNHTDDYQNIGGDINPVDNCQSGYLPGIDSLRGGSAGAGHGTIMSYCHLLNGGYGNIRLTFGKSPFTYGIKPYRVSDVMSSYVAQRASSIPGCLPIITPGEVKGLYSAILPSARSVAVGQTATAFATIINATGITATGCYPSLPNAPQLAATFNFQTTSASNQLIGQANTPIDLQPGAAQNYVFGITPNGAFSATDIPIVFDCSNTTPAQSQTGVNTFLLSASDNAPPDLIAIGATASMDGILRLQNTNSTGAFATSAINIGSSGRITASADTGAVNLSLSLTICQTNPTTGECINPPDIQVISDINNSVSVTYAIFAKGNGSISNDPASNRIYLRLKTDDGVIRGATSVAVLTNSTNP